MKNQFYFIVSFLLFFSACTGVDSRVKKSFKNTENTIYLKNLTPSGYEVMDAGSQLEYALEDEIGRSMFIVTRESPKYVLKYKVLRYKKGSRLGRFSSFGLLKSTQGQLEVKAALYEDGDQVGAWTIDAWIKGGFTGGDPNTLFQQAANKIMEHLRGNF